MNKSPILFFTSIIAGSLFANIMVLLKGGWNNEWDTGIIFGVLFGVVLNRYQDTSASFIVALRRSILLTFLPVVYLIVTILFSFLWLYANLHDYLYIAFPPIFLLAFTGLFAMIFIMIHKFNGDTTVTEEHDNEQQSN